MLTIEQINNLKKGDKLVYNNNGRKIVWEVDYPRYLINEKKSNIVYENEDNSFGIAKQVAVEAVAGGGDCTNRELGCVRVSIPVLNGRGAKRHSFLISDWNNWELPEDAPTPPKTPPTTTVTVTSVFPENNAIDVLTKPTLKFTFSNSIKIGSGYLKILKTSDNTEFVSISVNDSTQVRVVANLLQINVAAELDRNQEYEVKIDPGFVLDSTNLSIDILGDNTYKFKTAPTVVESTEEPTVKP